MVTRHYITTVLVVVLCAAWPCRARAQQAPQADPPAQSEEPSEPPKQPAAAEPPPTAGDAATGDADARKPSDPPDAEGRTRPEQIIGDPPDPEERARPVHIIRVHHAPIAVAEVDEPLAVRADLRDMDGFASAMVLYRTRGQKRFHEIELSRATDGPYLAEIPAEHVEAPALEYTIELVRKDDKRVPIFASRRKPHRVLVPRDGMDRIEEMAARRVDDRRSVFAATGEYVSFGRSSVVIDTAAGPESHTVNDRYWRVEGSYTYRPLRTVSEFSFAAGAIRGSAPSSDVVPGQDDSHRFNVGLNYGATRVRFRMADWFHVDGSLLASVTELGFSVGTGSALHIGRPYGNKLILGFEAIQAFGVRIYTRLDFMAHPQVKLSPIVEVTNMPSADAFGLRLLGELGVDIGWGMSASARGGYQARDATSGGPSGGGSLAYAF